MMLTRAQDDAARSGKAATGKGLGFDVARLRKDFPILTQKVHGKPLVYLDNAATAQTPRAVIDALDRYYLEDCSNIHRGVHTLSERATRRYEEARAKIQRFIGAPRTQEVIFVRGTTEAINLVAQTWGRANVRDGDEIILSAMEHHSNIVPWQMLAELSGARLRVIPMNDAGELDLQAYEALLGPRVRLVAVGHVSNALGTINPVQRITELAHAAGAVVLVDGAQAVPHQPVDVAALGCDFYAFSGHKLYGPMGIGVLWGREEVMRAMPAWQGGGDMIRSVTFEKTTYNDLPHKLEAGTPNVSGTIGLGAAVDYLEGVGMAHIAAYEQELLSYAVDKLSRVERLRLVGTARDKAAVCSFVLDDIHPHDVGTILDSEGIAVRTGHHCAQPVMDRFGVPATVRASFAFYNTRAEVDALVRGLERVREVFGR